MGRPKGEPEGELGGREAENPGTRVGGDEKRLLLAHRFGLILPAMRS